MPIQYIIMNFYILPSLGSSSHLLCSVFGLNSESKQVQGRCTESEKFIYAIYILTLIFFSYFLAIRNRLYISGQPISDRFINKIIDVLI